MEGHNYSIHQDIVERCLKGDGMAYNELYQLYSKAMFNTGYRIVGNTTDAEDVLQESFISAFNNLSSFKGDSSFGAWLKRIVVNKSINLIKKRKVDLTMTEVISESNEELEPIHFNENDLEVKRIKMALEKLPEGYRTVLSLYLFEGYDHYEISQILGISESTSKSQYNRSKKKLKHILEAEFS